MNTDLLAAEHFEWFIAAVQRRFGPAAEEYAGVAFMEVANSYDATKGAFRAYATSALEYAVKNQFSKDYGRINSRKRAALTTQASISPEAYDVEDDAPIDNTPSDFVNLLHRLDSLKDEAKRIVGICRVLGLFDVDDTAFIMGRRSIRGAFP